VLVNAVVWIPVLVWMKRKRSSSALELAVELARSNAETGERTVRGPERALYRGGTGNHSNVSGNSVMTLTDRRLVFLKATGGRVEVATEAIRSAAVSRAFLGGVRGRQDHVVITMNDGSQIGFIPVDAAAWVAPRARPSAIVTRGASTDP
jgi:hypothetical protein